jgi:hypothetical protein
MSRILILVLTLFGAAFITYATAAPNAPRPASEQIDYPGFQNLAREVHTYRAGRLVTLAQFQTMAREPNTIILDARSADAYREGHIEGALNLSLTDFTAPALAAAIKNPNTRILIYCNNNFENNARPVVTKMAQLSLNIQTFINLYGYGYKNVYELGEIVNFNDPKVRWVRG